MIIRGSGGGRFSLAYIGFPAFGLPTSMLTRSVARCILSTSHAEHIQTSITDPRISADPMTRDPRPASRSTPHYHTVKLSASSLVPVQLQSLHADRSHPFPVPSCRPVPPIYPSIRFHVHSPAMMTPNRGSASSLFFWTGRRPDSPAQVIGCWARMGMIRGPAELVSWWLACNGCAAAMFLVYA